MLHHIESSRAYLRDLFSSRTIHIFIAVLLAISAMTISWEITIRYHETPEAQSLVGYLGTLNTIILCLFALEIALRIFAFGCNYFKSAWNVFDFVVVGLSLLTVGSFFQIIRTFRLFLFLRTISVFPNFQHLITSLGHAIPRIFSTLMLLMFAIYIFAIWGVIEYSITFPELFGGLPIAFSTIFHSVLLGHTWSEIYDVMVKVDPDAGFFIYPMVVVLNFLLLQMVLGVIISALHFQNVAEQEHKKHSFILGWLTGKHKNHHDSPLSADTKIILHEIHKLKAELGALEAQLTTMPKTVSSVEKKDSPTRGRSKKS
ncbi:MAG: ion transporter [Candidatus Paracaedibacteraceae bacterium]|nr:ion transporter [Candidatus Paracaedibacteraceae bacterium]